MKRKQVEFWIEQEQKENYKEVEALVKEAFMEMTDGDPTEHILVKRIRKSETFVPELSMIARNDQGILGHILLSVIHIVGEDREFVSLAMAPVSVRPDFQGLGIGGALIDESIQKAKEMGFVSIIVLGHPDYYPRFGFRPTAHWQIRAEFDVPEEALMGMELEVGALQACRMGMIQYPDVFFEVD